jgi:hypothetical protein
MQAWFAYKVGYSIPPVVAVGIVLIFGTGYAIFAQANTQRQQFRVDPTKPIWGKAPKFIQTANKKNLLVSGWWGIARKINYTGDLILAYSFGLPCLHLGVAPFLYAGYLTVSNTKY